MKNKERGKKVQYYRRADKIRIDGVHGDLMIYGMEGEVLVTENKLYIKNTKEVSLNGELVSEEKDIQIGDILIIGKITINLFKEFISIQGENFESRLQNYFYKEIPFEDFPYYRRSPRILKKIIQEKILIKEPPQKENMDKQEVVQMVLPPMVTMMITVCLGIFMKRGIYVIAGICTTIVSVLFSVYKYLKDRKEKIQKNLEKEQAYEEYLLDLRAVMRKKRQQEKDAMEYLYPNAEKISQMVLRYDSRFYERKQEDEDFLRLTLGYRSGESAIRIEGDKSSFKIKDGEGSQNAIRILEDFGKISDIPVTVDLYQEHLGVIGERKNIHEQIKFLMMQICFFQSYHDVQIVFITDEEGGKEFEYLKWYPHLRIQAVNVTALVSTPSIRDQILGSILQIIKERKQYLEEDKKTSLFSPQYIFVIDEPKLICDHAIMEYLGQSAKELGISIIYTSDQVYKLPENIRTVYELKNSEQAELLIEQGMHKASRFNLVSMKNIEVEIISRKTAALIHERGLVSKIPDSITFFEMYHIKHPEELAVEKRWKNHAAYKSLAVPIGVREQDNYVELNLHEKAHGPHGLVAGTTGSGKSEIIQTYILSLAANFHPYEAGFLLIDYKGGGMANLFQNLPHLLGTITNLDGAASYRALVSIKSELARRQKIFSENGVNHINGYHKLYQLGEVTEPLPHLFLISDEFAELKKEQPEFMKELVSTARIGRSLGIHLILATQKPSGVVDEQIWTNSRFKLCLKVQNEADSKEMLKTADAAAIVQPGRAYLQVGNNEIYELFQSAFSGATYGEEQEKGKEKDNRVYLINALGQGQLINQDLGGTLKSDKIQTTQLDAVVSYIADTFKNMNIPKVKSPWLPPLKNIMVSPYLSEIQDSAIFSELDLRAVIGMEDIPTEQKQTDYALDFLRDGHVLFCASAGFGKTVFLENIILSLCVKNSVKNFISYILDFGNNALIAMKALPHVADYITYDDTEKQQKFISLIQKEIKDRKRRMAETMTPGFEIYRQSGRTDFPAILVLVDNYDIVREIGLDEGFFVQLARDGANLGIYLAITASRSSVVKFSLLNQIKNKIAGYNYETMEARALVGKSEYEVPEIKGRALVKQEGINLMQIYSPVSYKDGLDYNKKIRELAEKIKQESSEDKAEGIPVLPELLLYPMLSDYKSIDSIDINMGLEKQNVKREGICCSNTPFLIIGPVKSGKSNAGHLVLKQAMQFKTVYLFDSRDYEYKKYQKSDVVKYIYSKEMLEKAIKEISDLTEQRREAFELKKEEMSSKEFYTSLDKIMIFINNIGEFSEFSEDKKEIISVLMQTTGVGILVVMVGASNAIPARNETSKLVKMCECGLILGEYGINTSFPSIRTRDLPGAVEDGLLYKRGEITMIRLPRM